MSASAPANPYRSLPSVEEALRQPAVAALARELPRDLVASFVQEILSRWRAEIGRGELDQQGLEARLASGGLALAIAELAGRERRAGIRRAINATGVVLNTGLGRAPLHPEAAGAIERVARGYCVLEVDRESGERNERDQRIGILLARLLGCEAGIAVNNNAAAVLLCLAALARGKEVVLSRGELVEIGGSFRMPDVMAMAGCELREVGTTNRTRLSDYRAALSPRTGLLLKVHTSNFRVTGFTEQVEPPELASLGRESGVSTAYDLGSGLLDCAGAAPLDMLGDEPGLRGAVESGVDLILFSGDKLLGGPQAGLIAGKRERVDALRKNPLYRALRLDKGQIAGVERTLELLLAGRGDEIPTRAMLRLGAAQMRASAARLAAELSAISGLQAEVVEGESQPGSGSAPGIFLPGWVVRLKFAGMEAGALSRALRLAEPPVFARVQEGAVLLDPRTLLEGDEVELVRALREVCLAAAEKRA